MAKKHKGKFKQWRILSQVADCELSACGRMIRITRGFDSLDVPRRLFYELLSALTKAQESVENARSESRSKKAGEIPVSAANPAAKVCAICGGDLAKCEVRGECVGPAKASVEEVRKLIVEIIKRLDENSYPALRSQISFEIAKELREHGWLKEGL